MIYPWLQNVSVNAMILSAQFWPTFREEKITLPEHMQTLLEEYTKKFEAQKGNRTLNWKSHLGRTHVHVLWRPCITFPLTSLELCELYALCLIRFQKSDFLLTGNFSLKFESRCLISFLAGLVSIDVELKDRTLNFNVSPVQAAIIMQFQDQGKAQHFVKENLVVFWHELQKILRE